MINRLIVAALYHGLVVTYLSSLSLRRDNAPESFYPSLSTSEGCICAALTRWRYQEQYKLSLAQRISSPGNHYSLVIEEKRVYWIKSHGSFHKSSLKQPQWPNEKLHRLVEVVKYLFAINCRLSNRSWVINWVLSMLLMCLLWWPDCGVWLSAGACLWW